MTNLEVLSDLRGKTKPYEGLMGQGYFAEYCIRIQSGKCKPETVKIFFNRLGYVGKWDNFTKKEDEKQRL